MKAFRIAGRNFQCLKQRAHCFFFPVEGVQGGGHLIVGAGQVVGADVVDLVTALVDQFYKDVVARGGERWDTSSLIDLLCRP